MSPAGTAVAEWPQRPEGHEPDAKRGSASAKFNSQSCGVYIVPPTSSEARRSHRSAGLENSQRSSSLHSTMLSSGLANTRGESSRDGGVVSRRVGPRAARVTAEDGHHLVHGRQHHFRGRVRLPRTRHRPYRLKLRLRRTPTSGETNDNMRNNKRRSVEPSCRRRVGRASALPPFSLPPARQTPTPDPIPTRPAPQPPCARRRIHPWRACRAACSSGSSRRCRGTCTARSGGR